MTEKKIKILFLVKRLLFVTIIVYIALFFAMNTSYLSFDNLRRFGFSARSAITQTYATENDEFFFEQDTKPLWVEYKDGYAILDGSTLSVYSGDNLKYSSEKAGFSHPVIRSSDKYLLCYDRGGAALCVYDSFDEVFRYEGSVAVVNAAVDDSGVLAVVTQKDGFKGSVTVYDKQFREQFVWNSADAYPIDVCFTDTNSISVITISQNAEKISSSVTTFNYRTGKEKTNVTAEDAFPLRICPKYDNSVEILTETGLRSFRSGGVNSIFRFDSFTPELVFQGEKYTVFTHDSDPRTGKCKVTAVDVAGNTLFTAEESDVRAVSSFADSVIVLGTGKISVYDRNGELIAQQETDKVYSSLYTGKNHFFLISGGSALIMKTSLLIK